MEKEKQLFVRDWLAIERTRLANERTFLAYFRTSCVFLGGGLSLLKLELFSQISYLGVLFTSLAPVILLIGIIRLYLTKRKIERILETG